METLFHIGLSNAFAASVLAVLVFVVTRICRRPALGHALWLLVLLKLIAPPVLSVSIPWPAVQPEKERLAAADVPSLPIEGAPETEPLAAAPVEWTEETEPVRRDGASQTEDVSLPMEAVASLEGESALAIFESSPPAPAWVFPSWQTVAIAVWLAGSALWFAVVGLRILHFQRLLRIAKPSSTEIQGQAERVAEWMGMRRCPPVWLLPAPVSPMLWSLGGTPRLLLPEVLWQRLSDEQKECLLAHELAHWRRRDHWTRLLELVATGLYWWHPVAWWARRELRAAEEECCDAWVLWALPSSAKDYALAIVETLTFLSTSRRSCPVGASGMGQLQCLERRLTMIMRGSSSPALTKRGVVAVAILAAALLPWLPTWGQVAAPKDHGEAGPTEVAQNPATPRSSDQPKENAPKQSSGVLSADKQADAEVQKKMIAAARELKQLLNQRDVLLEQIKTTEARLKELTSKASLGTPAAPAPPARMTPALNEHENWDRRADQIFRKWDTDGNELLSVPELQGGLSITAERDKWNTNGDLFIDKDEFRSWFRAAMEQQIAPQKPTTQQRIASVEQRYTAYMRALLGRPESANASPDESVERQIIGLKKKYDQHNLEKRRYDELLAQLLPRSESLAGEVPTTKEITEQQYRELRNRLFVSLRGMEEQLDRTRAWLIKDGVQISEIERRQGFSRGASGSIGNLSTGRSGGRGAASSGQSGAVAGAPNKPAEKTFAFEMRDKPWAAVLEWFADQTGVPFVGSSKPTGTFTFIAPRGAAKSYTVPQIVDILNEALADQKSLLIRGERSFTLVAADEKVDPRLIPRLRVEELDQHGNTELATLILPLARLDAKATATGIRKMIGPFGEVHALDRVNQLILTDQVANLKRIYQTIHDIEKAEEKKASGAPNRTN